MSKWLTFALLLGLLTPPAQVSAQTGVKLDSMKIQLWPEYDQPSMLVITEFVLSQQTSLPAAVTIRFPKNGNLVAAAVESNGELFTKIVSDPVEQGNWQAVTLNVETYEPHRLEYYQPLTRDGDKRQFKYQWFGDYYVKDFVVSILVPADSTDLSSSPILQNTGTTTDGQAITGIVTENNLRMGHSFQFELAYRRTSSTLIAPGEANQVQPSEPVGPDTPGRVSVENLPLFIGGFGLALIGIALFSYWRSNRLGESQPRRRRRQTRQKDDELAYCHECGARAHPADRFCRTCGSRLRTE